MSKKEYHWPLFQYTPIKLIRIREELEKKWGRGDLPKFQLSSWAWDRLIEEIRKLEEVELVIESFAKLLKKRYLSVLSYQFLQVPEDVEDKVTAILSHRLSRSIIRNAWTQLQVKPFSKNLTYIIRQGFSQGISPFQINDSAHSLWKEAFQQENPIEAILPFSISYSNSFIQCSQTLRIYSESNLESALLQLTWQKAEKETFLRESADFIIERFKAFSLETLARILDRYLEVLNVEEIDFRVGNYLLGQFGRPDGKDQPEKRPHTIWVYLSQTSREKFLRWVYAKYIMDALQGDRERIAYWKKQVDRVDEVIVEGELGILVMFFKNFVIVEFTRRGNALYCYLKEVYFQHIRPRVKRAFLKNTNVYKDQNRYYERIIHNSGWQWKADELLRRITGG